MHVSRGHVKIFAAADRINREGRTMLLLAIRARKLSKLLLTIQIIMAARSAVDEADY